MKDKDDDLVEAYHERYDELTDLSLEDMLAMQTILQADPKGTFAAAAHASLLSEILRYRKRLGLSTQFSRKKHVKLVDDILNRLEAAMTKAVLTTIAPAKKQEDKKDLS